MTTKLRVLIAFLFLLSLPGTPADAQGALAGGVAATLTGGAILDRANRVLQDNLNTADQDASGLVDQALTGLAALLQAGNIDARNLTDKTLAQMQGPERDLLVQISLATDSVQSAIDKAYDLEQVSNIDISTTLSAVPFMKNAVFISQVKGLNVIHSDPTHSIQVFATGLGPGRAGRTATLQFYRNGQLFQPISVDGSHADESLFTFSAAQLDPYFAPRGVRTLPLEAVLTVKDSHWWGGVTTKTVRSPIFLTLYPDYLGSMTVEADVPQFGWVKVGDTRSYGQRSPDCGNGACGGGGRSTSFHTPPLPLGNTPQLGAQRVVNLRRHCGDPAFDFAACGYNNAMNLVASPDQTTATLSYNQTGVWVTWYIDYDVEEYSTQPSKHITIIKDLMYGQPVDFCVEGANPYFKVDVTLITKQRFTLTPSESKDPWIHSVPGTFACPGQGAKYVYQVGSPH